MEQIKRFPATISQPILQLMSEWSFLNYSGFRYKILASPDCPICSTPETTEHYLLNCIVFNNHRKKLISKLKERNLPLTLKSLFGITLLSIHHRHAILMSLFDYISDTKRKKLGYCQDIHKWKRYFSK